MKKNLYVLSVLICFMSFSISASAHVPVVSVNPVPATVCSGNTAKFFVTVTDTTTGATTIIYSWQVSTDGGTTWSLLTNAAPYSNATTDTLYVAASLALNGYEYRSIDTTNDGRDTSSAAMLTVDTLNAGTITGASALCIGAHDTLSDAVTGGVWSHTNNVADSLTPAGVVIGLSQGYDSVKYTVTSACGSVTAALKIHIDSLTAGTITGASAICAGTSVALTDAVSGGVWSHINHIADTLTNVGIVTGLAAGFDTVKYVVNNTCGTAIASLTLRVDVTATPMPVTGPTATCVGHTIDLANANVVGTWVWSASNGSASITHGGALSGLSDGFDTITYTFTNACNTVRDSIVIAIDTLLNPGHISGDTSVCAGSWIHLSETVGGGIWVSTSGGAVVDGSGNVTGVSAGTVLIYYLVSNACGESIAPYYVTVDSAAATISGGDSVGVGATLGLSDRVPGGAWSIAGAIATINSAGVVTGVAPGTTTVTYTDTNTCGTSSVSMVLYVGHAPSGGRISGPDTICVGVAATLSDTTYPGGVWTSSNNSIATINSSTGAVTGVANGYVNIYYAIHNAFGADTLATLVYVNVPPVISVSGPSYVSLSQDYFLLGGPCCGVWTATNGIMGSFVSFGVLGDTVVDSVRYSSAVYGSFVVAAPGKDTLIYTMINGCGITRDSIVLSLSAASVHAVTAEHALFNVYPNPNQGEFTLNLSHSTNEQVPVTITNIVGEKVKELTIPTNTPVNIKLDQPEGIYFISAIASDGKYTAKITITK